VPDSVGIEVRTALDRAGDLLQERLGVSHRLRDCAGAARGFD
jgi:hypothetical protein